MSDPERFAKGGHVPAGADSSPKPIVYQFDTDLDRKPWLLDMERREPLIRFLHAHGLQLRFIMGETIKVRHHRDDGTLWLCTRRATAQAPRVEMCPHCDGCVKTEKYMVPLVAPVPYIEDAYVKADFRDRLTSAGG